MKKEYVVTLDTLTYPVLVSDEKEALLAAKAAGRAVLGLWDERHPEKIPAEIPYLVQEEAQITPVFLERIVRRQLGLPWIIAETRRLRIREFTAGDWENLSSIFCAAFGRMAETELFWEERPAFFTDASAFLSYIHCQYPFFEYGLWAVEERTKHRLIGGCGFWDRDRGERWETEIGYWISPSFQRMGYGTEALKAVLRYAEEIGKIPLYATIQKENIPSQKLAEKLKFSLISHSHPGQSKARRLRYRYVPYC